MMNIFVRCEPKKMVNRMNRFQFFKIYYKIMKLNWYFFLLLIISLRKKAVRVQISWFPDNTRIASFRAIFAEILLLQKFSRNIRNTIIISCCSGLFPKGMFVHPFRLVKISFDCAFKAYAMDNTDVYFVNKFGFIALKQQNMHLAGMLFQRVRNWLFSSFNQCLDCTYQMTLTDVNF